MGGAFGRGFDPGSCAIGWAMAEGARRIPEACGVIVVGRVVFLVRESRFLRVGCGAGTVAVPWGRGGAEVCLRGAHVVPLLGALNFAGSAPQDELGGRDSGASFWCRVSTRSRSGRYADSRLAAVVSMSIRRARVVGTTGACITDLNCSQFST